MLNIFRKTPVLVKRDVEISVELDAFRKINFDSSKTSKARIIAEVVGSQELTKNVLITAFEKSGLGPQLIHRYYPQLLKEISTRRLWTLAKLLQSEGSMGLSRTTLMAGILSGNAPDHCWEELSHSFAKTADWQNTLECNTHALRTGENTFYRLWHASSLNFILGDSDKAIHHLKEAKLLAYADDEISRVFPLEVLAHFHSADKKALVKIFTDREKDSSSKLPDWVNRRISIAYSGLIKTKTQFSTTEIELMSMTEELLDITIQDTSIWEHIALLSPSTPDLARQYLKAELEKNNPDINVEVLAIIEAITPRQSQDIPILLAAYSRLGRIPDALRVINEAENYGASLFDILEGLTKSLKSKQHSLELLRASHAQHPNDEKIARLYGINAHISGQQGSVVETLLPLFEKQNDKLSADEIYALGVALQMTNRPERAIDVLNQVDLFSDHFAMARSLKQKIYYQLKDFPNTIKSCLETLAGNPNDSQALRMVSIAYRANAQHKNAFKSASRLLAISKPHSQQHMEAITLLGTEARLTNDPEYIAQAIEQIDSLNLVKGAGWNFALQLIALLCAMGAYEQAYNSAHNLLQRNPNSTTILMWMGALKTITGRVDVEFDQLTKSTLSQPHGMEILLAEATASLKQGNSESAIEKLLATQDYDCADLQLYKRAAEAYLVSDSPEKAIVHLKSAIKLEPKDKSISSLLSHIQRNKSTPFPELSYDESEILSITGKPKITIVVPCYNEARFLSDCLNSIWMQSYPYWECIIVDDKGSDQSAKIAKAYCEADKRFKYHLHKSNKGLASSRNTGLKMARADYVTFLDSDDFLSLDSLNSRYQVLKKRNSEFLGGVYCQIRPCDEDKFIPLADANQDRIQNMGIKNFTTSGFEAPFNAHAPLLKVAAIRDVDGFTESMKHGAEDWDCWQRMMRKGYTFLPSHWIGGYYRQKRGSMVRALSKFHVAEAEKLYQRSVQNDIKINTDIYNFKYPVWVYQGIHSFYKRALRFAAMAHMAGDIDGFYEIVERLPGSQKMCEALNFSIHAFVKDGVNRFLSSTDEKIGSIDRKLYKEECTNEISDKIIAQLEGRHPDTNIETLFPSASGTTNPKRSTPKLPATNFASSIPTYVKLEESQKRVKDTERIKKLHNIHAGERVFIVGNGPSLNKIDLSKLKDEYSIAVNGIFYKTEQSGYRPNYYVVEDTSVMRENIAEIKAYEVEKKFFPTIYNDIHPEDENTYFFKMNRGFYEPKSPNYCVPRFSTDFSQRAFCGQSVTFINLQLAFYMGFKEVYLIGMDFSYIIPENFERKGDIITSTDDDPNHFHPDYFGKGKTWKDPKLDRVLANYNMAKLAYETAGRKIYNATAGGKLELFERKKFNSLFK